MSSARTSTGPAVGPGHVRTSADLDRATIVRVLSLAGRLREERRQAIADGRPVVRDELAGRTVALVFEKPSTRTRVSFQVAVTELGGAALPLSSAELQLGRGETIADTAAVLSRYVHAIVLRTFGQERLDELADAASVPVINALSDLDHPCQALADLLTLQDEFGRLQGVALAYVGDGNNVAHALLVMGATMGLDVRVAHPEGHAPDPAIVAEAARRAEAAGGRVSVTTDVDAAVEGADALYTDVWVSMGQEDAPDRREAFVPYRLDEALLARAAEHAIVLHCLPAHRGEEISGGAIDGPSSRVFDQAENRLHVQKALLVERCAVRPAGPA
ncbi:MAG: ornithine carbamoyltransferase [Actinomycetota bacterium]|jgi:ornithine carbamoyltransferase